MLALAKPKNRSLWIVKLAGREAQKFACNPRPWLFWQLETAFEVQVIRKDGQGNVVRRSETFDTYTQAEKYAAQQDIDLERILQTQSGFEVG